VPWVLTPPLHKLQHNNPLMKVRRVTIVAVRTWSGWSWVGPAWVKGSRSWPLAVSTRIDASTRAHMMPHASHAMKDPPCNASTVME